MLHVFARKCTRHHYFRSSVINVVCACSREQKKCEERTKERKRKKRKRKSRDEKQQTDREREALPEKKRRAKNETKIPLFFSSLDQLEVLVFFSSSTNTNTTNNNNNNKGV